MKLTERNPLKILKIYVLLALLSSCSSVFYHPTDYVYARPETQGVFAEEIWVKSLDGTRINAMYLRNKANLRKPKGLVVFFHGNAQNLSSHWLNLAWMTRNGFDLLIWDYRGYGKSGGEAEPKGIYEDSLAVLKYASNRYKLGGHEKLILYGQSLGGSIALKAFENFPKRDLFDLIVLEASFLSYEDIVVYKLKKSWLSYIFFPLGYLFSDRYSPKNYVKHVRVPTLVIHGTEDDVVPYEFSVNTFETLETKKWFWKIKGGRHLNTYSLGEGKFQRDFVKLVSEL